MREKGRRNNTTREGKKRDKRTEEKNETDERNSDQNGRNKMRGKASMAVIRVWKLVRSGLEC